MARPAVVKDGAEESTHVGTGWLEDTGNDLEAICAKILFVGEFLLDKGNLYQGPGWVLLNTYEELEVIQKQIERLWQEE